MKEKEAIYYKKLKDKKIQCTLCPNQCTISKGQESPCRTRKNIDGKFYLMTYGKPASAHPDVIEKKPLYHFLPGTVSFSICTIGCTLHCLHCQNYSISQASASTPTHELSPRDIVNQALASNCRTIAYTYTEPFAYMEFALDTAKLAKKKGLKNVIVSNGYVNQEPLKAFLPFIDAANIDLKAFTDRFYREISKGKLKPVLETLKTIKQKGVWLEITNLIIPTKNDSKKEIKEMCKWIKENLGEDTPIHFSRFYPAYKMTKIEPTPIPTLKKAEKIAKKYLNFVYLGNIPEPANTYCPKCKTLLIERCGYSVKSHLVENKCPDCKAEILGLWF